MASMQVLRQRNAGEATKTHTHLDQKQSLEIVQTMIHSALSTITYLRNLFPEKAYTTGWYELRDTVLPYADYAAVRMPRAASEAGDVRVQIPILQRGRSRRVEMFLLWIVRNILSVLEPVADNYQGECCLWTAEEREATHGPDTRSF